MEYPFSQLRLCLLLTSLVSLPTSSVPPDCLLQVLSVKNLDTVHALLSNCQNFRSYHQYFTYKSKPQHQEGCCEEN